MENQKDELLFNTGSSIYMADSIAVPNVRKIIESIATIIHAQMQDDLNQKKTVPKNSELHMFSEQLYIKNNKYDFDQDQKKILWTVPSEDNIFEFIKALYDGA